MMPENVKCPVCDGPMTCRAYNHQPGCDCYDNPQERNPLFAKPLDATKLIAREGWFCTSCGHRHAGPILANICVGCSCPETAPLGGTAEDDWIRIASENAQDATARLVAVQQLYEQALDQRDSALQELTDTRRFWQAAKDALQAEKIVSQEHWNYFLLERSECGRLSVALKEIADMDLQYAESKDMHDRAVAALARPVREDV